MLPVISATVFPTVLATVFPTVLATVFPTVLTVLAIVFPTVLTVLATSRGLATHLPRYRRLRGNFTGRRRRNSRNSRSILLVWHYTRARGCRINRDSRSICS